MCLLVKCQHRSCWISYFSSLSPFICICILCICSTNTVRTADALFSLECNYIQYVPSDFNCSKKGGKNMKTLCFHKRCLVPHFIGNFSLFAVKLTCAYVAPIHRKSCHVDCGFCCYNLYYLIKLFTKYQVIYANS